jgi:radical SAM superfamily enzyme YgiQ (UPF0313 family)
MTRQPSLLLINPPVYDFVAYDLWSKPLGLLYLAAILRNGGFKISLLDCMDRNMPGMPATKHNSYGCGPYYSEQTPKPAALSSIPRKYRRFGLPADSIKETLRTIASPDAILISSVMTYWYPGVIEAIKCARETFPAVPIILGGTYATLCTEHAKEHCGADKVVPGHDPKDVVASLQEVGIMAANTGSPATFAHYPAPAYDLYNSLNYFAIRTSVGCPCSCTYCAINQLSPGYCRKASQTTASEIIALADRGIQDVVFYDDALLYQADDNIIPLLNRLAGYTTKLRFHTPNGLHSRYLSKETAAAMHNANFIMPRLSLETVSPNAQKRTGGKVSNTQFEEGIHNLKAAGYKPGQYAAYIMMGMPNQDLTEVEETIRYAHSCGAHISLGEYSPIPGTKDWQTIQSLLPSDDPLWHNNSINPLHPLSDWPMIQSLKDLTRELNN